MKKHLILLKKKRFYIFLISIILFIVMAIFISNNHIVSLDSYGLNIGLYLRKFDFLYYFFFIITNLASAYFLIFLAITFLITYKGNKDSLFISFNLLISWLLNVLLKNVFMRNRPDIMLLDEIGFSFPSGHATVSFAFYGFLIYLIYLKMKGKKKYVLILLLSILVLLIGLSRLYFNVHYLSDILGGYLLSLAYLIVFISVYNYLNKKE